MRGALLWLLFLLERDGHGLGVRGGTAAERGLECQGRRDGQPRLCLSASWSALSADAVGLTVKLKLPAAATARLPFAKMTSAGRHLPASLTWPLLHFLVLAANAPNFPFWKVISHAQPPGSTPNSPQQRKTVSELQLAVTCTLA